LEVEAVVEHENGRAILIEVKSSVMYRTECLTPMKTLADSHFGVVGRMVGRSR